MILEKNRTKGTSGVGVELAQLWRQPAIFGSIIESRYNTFAPAGFILGWLFGSTEFAAYQVSALKVTRTARDTLHIFS